MLLRTHCRQERDRTFQRLHDKSMPRPEKRPQDSRQECSLSLLCFHPPFLSLKLSSPSCLVYFMLSSAFACAVPSLPLLLLLPVFRGVFQAPHCRMVLVHILTRIQCCWLRSPGNTQGWLRSGKRDTSNSMPSPGLKITNWDQMAALKRLRTAVISLYLPSTPPSSSRSQGQYLASSRSINSKTELPLQTSYTGIGSYDCRDKKKYLEAWPFT